METKEWLQEKEVLLKLITEARIILGYCPLIIEKHNYTEHYFARTWRDKGKTRTKIIWLKGDEK